MAEKNAVMWLGDMEGNSLYLFGEELTNSGIFDENDEMEAVLSEWVDWARDAAKLISLVNSEFAITVVERYLPEMEGEQIPAGIPIELFADVNSTPMPLLWYPFGGMER